MQHRHPASWLAAIVVAALQLAPANATGHGSTSEQYRTRILEIEPAGLPVDVRMVQGDQIRFENTGDEDLLLCGYEKACTPWVRIGPDGVFEDRNSEAFYANSEGDEQGEVPEGAGEGPAEFARVRREPAFYTYHDHRVHWMGGSTLPPNVDTSDSSPQKVFDGEVTFRYGDTDGVVRARLEYVGGQSALEKYGEYALVGIAVLAMLVVFAVDARRRRRRAPATDPAE